MIIGVVLVVIALALYVFTSVSYWLAVLVAAVGLIFVVLAFAEKGKNLPIVVPESKPVEIKEETPFEAGSNSGETEETNREV